MFLTLKQKISMSAIPVLLLICACASQESRNSSTEADQVNVRKDSAITAVQDTSQKPVAGKFIAPVVPPGEVTIGSGPQTGVMLGRKAGKDVIIQPPFEKSLPAEPERPQEITDGIHQAARGNLSGAIVKFDEAITKNPKNDEAYFFRAKAEIELNQPDKAINDLNLAIELDNRKSLYYYYRGKLLSDASKQDLAITDFNNAISLKNDFSEAYNFRGVAKAMLQKHKDAIEDYDICIKGNPKYSIVYYNKGTSQASLKDYKAAIGTFTKGIEIDTLMIKAYLNRGNCRLMTSNIDGAIADFNKVISLSPQSSEAYFNRGYAKYFGKKEGMCDDWRKALSLGHKEAAKMLEENCK